MPAVRVICQRGKGQPGKTAHGGRGIFQQELDQGGAGAGKTPFGRKALIDEELEDGAGQVMSEAIRTGSPASAARQKKGLMHARARGPAVCPGAEGTKTPMGRGSKKQPAKGNNPLGRDRNCPSKDGRAPSQQATNAVRE